MAWYINADSEFRTLRNDITGQSPAAVAKTALTIDVALFDDSVLFDVSTLTELRIEVKPERHDTPSRVPNPGDPTLITQTTTIFNAGLTLTEAQNRTDKHAQFIIGAEDAYFGSFDAIYVIITGTLTDTSEVVFAEGFAFISHTISYPDDLFFLRSLDQHNAAIRVNPADERPQLYYRDNNGVLKLYDFLRDETQPQQVIEISSNYTLDPCHANALIRINTPDDIIITLPEDVNFEETFNCCFTRIGTGAVTFEGQNTVVIDSHQFKIWGQFTAVACHYVGVNRFQIYGDLY